MENFEQTKVSAAQAETGMPGVEVLLPLAHREKEAAETRGLIVFLTVTALVFLTWPALTGRLGTIVTFVVMASLYFAAAYVLAGTRRKREVAALTVSVLEDLRRVSPEKWQRALVQKLLADRIRHAARGKVGLKRGARPYTPQEKPGWKSVDFRRLLDLRATGRKNRGDRAAFLYTMACFMGFGFVSLIPLRLIHIFVWRVFPLTKVALLAVPLLALTLCLTWLLRRRYWLNLAEVYAYALDCERDSFYAVWNEAAHLHGIMSKSDLEQKDGETGTAGGARRRHRGGRGKKRTGGENTASKPAADKPKPASNS